MLEPRALAGHLNVRVKDTVHYALRQDLAGRLMIFVPNVSLYFGFHGHGLIQESDRSTLTSSSPPRAATPTLSHLSKEKREKIS